MTRYRIYNITSEQRQSIINNWIQSPYITIYNEPEFIQLVIDDRNDADLIVVTWLTGFVAGAGLKLEITTL